MSTCKIQIHENGSIYGEAKIEADDDAFWVDGIEVDEVFHQEVSADLERAIATWYFDFDAEIFVLRPLVTTDPVSLELSISSGDLLTILDLPVPCVIKVDDQEFAMSDPEDTTFELVLDFPGTYALKVESWPYQNKSWEVTAV